MKIYGYDSGKDCVDVSWDASIEELRNTTVLSEGGVGIRQWIYQTCTQFGYCKYIHYDKYKSVCKSYLLKFVT